MNYSYINTFMHFRVCMIGERERANLVVQLARFFCIISLSMSIRARRAERNMFHVVLNIRHMRKMRMRILSPRTAFCFGVRTQPLSALCIQFLLATSMDSECPTPNVQPTLDDGATPSAEACDRTAATARSRASESTEARDRKLARDRARRRERLASETAEEKERRLSQRRVRDRARRAASRPSAHSEKRLE